MAYPTSLDSFTNPSGTNTLNSPDHAGLHTSVNGAILAVETVLGTTLGTAVVKNFVAGDFAARVNGETLGTPKINLITSTGTATPVKISSAGLAPQGTTVSDAVGGTITPNAAGYQVLRVVFGTTAGNRTFGTPVNPTADQSLVIAIKASGSANGTAVWDSGAYRFSTSGTPTVGTAASWNYFGWRYNATDSKWDFQGQSNLVA